MTQYLIKICSSNEQRAEEPESDRQKRNTQTPHFHTYSGAHCLIFPKRCIVTEDVQTIKKVESFFDPTHSFNYREHG